MDNKRKLLIYFFLMKITTFFEMPSHFFLKKQLKLKKFEGISK